MCVDHCLHCFIFAFKNVLIHFPTHDKVTYNISVTPWHAHHLTPFHWVFGERCSIIPPLNTVCKAIEKRIQFGSCLTRLYVIVQWQKLNEFQHAFSSAVVSLTLFKEAISVKCIVHCFEWNTVTTISRSFWSFQWVAIGSWINILLFSDWLLYCDIMYFPPLDYGPNGALLIY